MKKKILNRSEVHQLKNYPDTTVVSNTFCKNNLSVLSTIAGSFRTFNVTSVFISSISYQLLSSVKIVHELFDCPS